MPIATRVAAKFGVLRAALALALTAIVADARPQTVLLRDSIGPTNTTTNGNYAFNCTDNGAGVWFQTPVRLAPDNDITLLEFRGVMAPLGDSLDFAGIDYEVRIWDSAAALAASPTDGNIADAHYAAPTGGPTAYGVALRSPAISVTSYELVFDLRPLLVAIPAGGERLISVQARSLTGTANSGIVGWVESTETGPTDFLYRWNNTPLPIDTIAFSLHDGRLAFEVTAELVNPPCPGDANGDNIVNFADLNIVLSEFGTSGSGLQGDLDDDGDVDFADLNIVLSAFGTSC